MHGRGTLDFGYSSRRNRCCSSSSLRSPSPLAPLSPPGVGVGERTSQRVNVETPRQVQSEAAKTVRDSTISVGRERFRKVESWREGGREEGGRVEREEEVAGIKRRENQLAGPPSKRGGNRTVDDGTGRDGSRRILLKYVKTV